MQLWQQQLMSKQLQERRRLLQLQQLDQEARQLSPHSQLAALGKPAAGNLPETLNTMALNDAYNYMWPNNFAGGISNIPTNSHMFIAGNMNLAQPSCSTGVQNLENGDIVLNDQSRAMRSMGFMPIQNDQSIFGMPVSGTSHADQYPQFLEMSNNCNDLMTKTSLAMAEKASRSASTFQIDQQSATQGCLQDTTSSTQQYFQGRQVFGDSSMQVLRNDVASGNFQQGNSLQLHDQFHEFHGRQEQDGSPGNLQEKSVLQVGTSIDASSLDPIEQKLLFGTDDENWGASLGGSLISSMGGDMHRPPVDNNYSGALPSINSGSWSALMQEAVQASSSDKGGVQEEWSGLSSQKTEQPIGKPLITTNGYGKQPAAWDVRSLQNATSLTSMSFPLFNDSNATQNPLISSQGANNKEFLNSQRQTKLTESGAQGKMTSATGIWAGQSTEQCENSSTDIQFKSQDMGDGWIDQQNLPISGVSIQPVHSLSGWQTSYPMASKGDSNSNYHDVHGNLWKVGENHVYPNSGLQHANSDIGSPKMQAEDPFATSLESIGNPNTMKLDQSMHQQVINEQSSVFGRHLTTNTYLNQVDKDDENQKQQSRRQQAWELSTSSSAERLVDSYEKENNNGRVFPGKGYVGDAAKDFSGNQKFPVQYGQHSMGPKIFQTGSLKKIAEPSFSANHQLSLQRLSNSGFDGSISLEQSFVAQSHFAGNACNDHVDSSKRIASEAEALQYRNDTTGRASSSSFDGSTSQYSHNETILQSSNNMLELLHKVDQSRNGDSVNVSDTSSQAAAHVPVAHTHFDASSNVRGFGLRLAPPSQRQSLPNYVPNSKQLLNDIKVGLSGETGYQDQASADYTSSVRHVPPLDGAFEMEKWDKISTLSGNQHNVHPESNKYCNSSATVSDRPFMENQLQEQRQLQQNDISSTKGHLEQKWLQQSHNNFNTFSHESPDRSAKFSFGNQTNVGVLGKNASLDNNLHDSHDAVASQSVQTTLHPLGGRFSTADVASIAENRVTNDSQFSAGGIDHPKPTFAGFSQITNSSKSLPVVETKLGSQPSISGISQQAGFSKMLNNVWTNISAQQRQAGSNPLLTPNVLQSIINHGRDRSSWGIRKAGGHQVNKEVAAPEVGTSSNSQKEEDNPLQGKSSNVHTEKVDAIFKSRTATQAQEAALKSSCDGGSDAPLSSLARQHQLDVNKTRSGQASAVTSQVLHSPTNVASSSNEIVVSGQMSKPLDVRPQNYSLLHQIQSMRAADSDLSKMAGNIAKGASFNSDTSQRNFNMHQRFDYGQNSASRFPADVKAGEASRVSYPLDAKMLSFASNDSEEKIPSTSVAGQHDVQTQMHSMGASATATVLGGSEHSRISPQMAPSWFDHYGNYQNGRMAALYAAQRSGNSAMQQYLLQKIPARIEDNSSMEQRLNNNQVDSSRHGILATKITSSESSGSLLPSSILDHGIILRSKKRKSLTEGIPWHKIVMECPQSLQDISSAELDWNLVANRLMEKVDDEAEAVEDDLSVPQSRRRLIMSTQLIHQLIPAVPAALLKGEATSAYESVTFSVTKSALADACSLVSSTKSDLHEPLENETTTSGELRSSKVHDTNASIVEDFIDKSKKLDADFSRLEKGSSMLDVRLECQDLERFSIVNRLGKFHSRAHADGVEVSATGTVHRTFPQRYITAHPVPGNLPDGVPCLTL